VPHPDQFRPPDRRLPNVPESPCPAFETCPSYSIRWAGANAFHQRSRTKICRFEPKRRILRTVISESSVLIRTDIVVSQNRRRLHRYASIRSCWILSRCQNALFLHQPTGIEYDGQVFKSWQAIRHIWAGRRSGWHISPLSMELGCCGPCALDHRGGGGEKYVFRTLRTSGPDAVWFSDHGNLRRHNEHPFGRHFSRAFDLWLKGRIYKCTSNMVFGLDRLPRSFFSPANASGLNT